MACVSHTSVLLPLKKKWLGCFRNSGEQGISRRRRLLRHSLKNCLTETTSFKLAAAQIGSGSTSKTVRVWDASTGQQVSTHFCRGAPSTSPTHAAAISSAHPCLQYSSSQHLTCCSLMWLLNPQPCNVHPSRMLMRMGCRNIPHCCADANLSLGPAILFTLPMRSQQYVWQCESTP